MAQYLVNLNVWTHNLLTLAARTPSGKAGAAPPGPKCSSDHGRLNWAAASAFVIAYSYAVAVTARTLPTPRLP